MTRRIAHSDEIGKPRQNSQVVVFLVDGRARLFLHDPLTANVLACYAKSDNMTDLFADKAADWDSRPVPLQLSEGIGAAIISRVDLHADHTVLDFGAGTGLLTGRIAPKVATVVAVDVSPSMLDQLAAKPELKGKVEPVCQNILETPLNRRVKLIVSAMAMHHVQDTPKLLQAFYSHLEPGGQIAVADLDTEAGDFHAPGIEGVFHHGFDRAALTERMRQAGFIDVAFDTACSIDKEGKRYSVFLATAKRPTDLPNA